MQNYTKTESFMNKSKQVQTSGELFEAVQLTPCFKDSKHFVDMTPKYDSKDILIKYHNSKNSKDFDILEFVEENFIPPFGEKFYQPKDNASLKSYIEQMWSFLSQQTDIKDKDNSLIALPKPYIIPGGRFREVYYWDTYFTCEGLRISNDIEMIKNVADNFKYLIETVGFIPNANRTYYLTRSQPPLFYLIVNILHQEFGINAIKDYLPVLEIEYNFWMNTARNVNGLNRYWDEDNTPRPESYIEDIEHANSIENKNNFYRNVRAACESGWDFSSRWFAKDDDFNTLQTTDILPIDLNSYLYGFENLISKWFKEIGNEAKATNFANLASIRKNKIQTQFWNDNKNFFCDINHISNTHTHILSLAGTTPLFLNIATPEQAHKVAKIIEKDFLTEYGLVTTLHNTSQQWDSPNGWAPLHWQTVIGLRNYGFDELAKTIATRFVKTVGAKFNEISKIREKYDVCDPNSKATGGEYIVQDGFGWTNGVVLAFMDMYNLYL